MKYMETTLFLAQILGLFSIILAVAGILRRQMIVHVVNDFLKDRSLAFVVGVAEVVAGLLLVLTLSTWATPLEVALGVLGWLILLEGVFYLFAGKRALKKVMRIFDNVSAYYFFAMLYLLLGVYLTYVGFGLNILG